MHSKSREGAPSQGKEQHKAVKSGGRCSLCPRFLRPWYSITRKTRYTGESTIHKSGNLDMMEGIIHPFLKFLVIKQLKGALGHFRLQPPACKLCSLVPKPHVVETGGLKKTHSKVHSGLQKTLIRKPK